MKTFTILFISIIVCNSIVNAQPNYLDQYINNPVTVTTIGTSANLLNQPRDLDFKPGTNELWVCNYGDSLGGTIVIFYNAGLPNQSSEFRFDDHSDHFMRYPSSIAFSDIGEWASVGELQNSYGSLTATFMGPTLWLSDTSIFARLWQNAWANGTPLGSHIDMLHQSPFAMGIAWDTAKVYWVMDGYNGNICKYDYVHDHSPGYDNHSAGIISRYSDVTVSRVPLVPSHLVLDKAGHWLYYIDGGNKKVKRMDVSSGVFAGNLVPPGSGFETLSGYYNYLGATVEDVDSLGTQPSGIDYYKNRLVVSDYTTGDIYLYNTSAGITLLDTIVTGHPGMMGVKIGPDGHIWCVNHTDNKVYRLDAAPPLLDAALISIVSPLVENDVSKYYSTGFNVCDNGITPVVSVRNTGLTTITNMTIEYSLGGTPVISHWTGSLAAGNSQNISLTTASLVAGPHTLIVKIDSVNGAQDDVELNNVMAGSFRIFPVMQVPPFMEDFSSNTFPPQDWNYIHFNTNNLMSRSAASAFGTGTGSLKMNNYAGPMDIAGQKDYMMMPPMDLSASASTRLRFDVAYARRNAGTQDELKVEVSSDCGNTWTQVYNKSGAVLSTASTQTSSFTPTAAQWRTDSADLSFVDGQPEVLVMFTTISDYGNNLYLDNINIPSFNVGTKEVIAQDAITIYPNPSASTVTVRSENTIEEINVVDLMGRSVLHFGISSNSKSINISDLRPGIYGMVIKQNGYSITKRIVKE